MGRALHPAEEELRRAKIRAAALERHFRARDHDGRSTLAAAAGRAGGLATVSRYPGGPRAWSLRMNLARRGVPFHRTSPLGSRQRLGSESAGLNR